MIYPCRIDMGFGAVRREKKEGKNRKKKKKK